MGKASPRAEAAVSVTFDTGALIALQRGDSRLLALLQLLVRRGGRVHVPAGVVGQAWRGGRRQALLARLLVSSQVRVLGLDLLMAKACGELCAASGTSDVVDASVVLVAREHHDAIVTSDVDDLRRLDPSAQLKRI